MLRPVCVVFVTVVGPQVEVDADLHLLNHALKKTYLRAKPRIELVENNNGMRFVEDAGERLPSI